MGAVWIAGLRGLFGLCSFSSSSLQCSHEHQSISCSWLSDASFCSEAEAAPLHKRVKLSPAAADSVSHLRMLLLSCQVPGQNQSLIDENYKASASCKSSSGEKAAKAAVISAIEALLKAWQRLVQRHIHSGGAVSKVLRSSNGSSSAPVQN